jgi:hypothetical protein
MNRLFLQIHREVNVSDPSSCQRRPTGEIGNRLNMRRSHDPGIVDGNIGEDSV